MTKLSLKNIIVTVLAAIVTFLTGAGYLSDLTQYLTEENIAMIASVLVAIATFASPAWLKSDEEDTE